MDLLTGAHRALLTAVAKSELRDFVYFTGGTLLAYHYLQHRRSLDLDFFSDDLLEDIFVTKNMRQIALDAEVEKIRYVRFPSRWQYFLTRKGEEIKFDIVYFPFPAIGKREKLPEFQLQVDSLKDIAVNKVHACYERQAPRDVFDLCIILKRKPWTLDTLIQDVERKFGVLIDLVHLIARIHSTLEKFDEMKPLFLDVKMTADELRAFFSTFGKKHLRQRLR